MLNPPLPVIVAPPGCCACTVIGALAVPARLMLIGPPAV